MRDTSMAKDVLWKDEFSGAAQDSLLRELHDGSVALSDEAAPFNNVERFPVPKSEANRTVPPFIGLRSLYPGDDAPYGTPGTGEAICRPCRGTGEIEIGGCYNCGGTGIVIEGIG